MIICCKQLNNIFANSVNAIGAASEISFVLILHRMPAAKRAKLEKVIKSVDKKKDVLTLECEWAACEFVCNNSDTFLVHISHHVDEMMMCEAVESSQDTGNDGLS